ncbi:MULTISPECIES: helix-turn-helix transcriptional regulator [Streptomyces]|uniref:Putative LuxR-family regulator n=1 Tax=Streptomyces scabiei (strain 87.22) TaxID=680198 RepID=C9Z0E5_STRSW|nr:MULTISPECIES: response regulator transcription factor [Streptomyces]MBP5859701.1 response regulator transcription factor [Streptomyces sp. LBUM 1484]MBP5871607.1 response regulator transcription factor [Streptomyces sp. LBUM 1485]MBP5927074.1 response regulator transcription factor [Streptomyces sp. LBUM 1479]KFG06437.1 LuxR family transcriptional regulator [Streptomyces scabiei]MBP5880062.1 response regulator transcription factor [Streptomyces sp. LBUM 1477]
MLTHHQLAAAARIGMLTRERDTASACAEALHELGRALPLDAATLLEIDPITGTHVQVAGLGYDADVSAALAAEFVSTPWYANVLRSAIPPSISEDVEDPGERYRDGWFYAERMRPAGVRDAVTGALHHHGRLVGLITLSTATPDAYDTDTRRLLASLLPALGVLADPTAHAGDLPDLPSGGRASLAVADDVLELPGRDPALVLRDTEFRRLVRAFADSGGTRLRLLWPVGPDWHRVTVRRHTLGSAVVRRAVLVHETPAPLPYGLSPRELEVLTRAATGMTNQAIAQALFLSPRTVHTHVEHLLRKTGAASRAEATALAVRDGLLRPTAADVERFVEGPPGG